METILKPVQKRNKEQTKQRLINAVGEIIAKEGYAALGVNKIARQANVNKKLIYKYFQNADRLIEAYLVRHDYWLNLCKARESSLELKKGTSITNLAISLLEDQFLSFHSNQELQQLILWELSGQHDLLRSMANLREEAGAPFLKLTDKHCKNPEVNIRAVEALLVAGIYYLTIHASNNGSTFCEIDINEEEGRNEVIKAIKLINELVFKEAKKRVREPDLNSQHNSKPA